MLNDELTIRRLAKKYEFKRCDIFGDEVYINSKCDEWLIREGGGILELWHRNEYDAKARWHKQRNYFDIPYMFKSIADHDKFKTKTRYIKPCKMRKLFDEIACSK